MVCIHPQVNNNLPASIVNTLYKAQREAAEMALKYKEINIFGPAANGKSQTLAALILSLILQKTRVLVCAPTNVAIDSIFARVCSQIEGFPSWPTPLVLSVFILLQRCELNMPQDISPCLTRHFMWSNCESGVHEANQTNIQNSWLG